MRFLPWNTDDLHRYSRALTRAYPQLWWWHAGLKAWETMLAAPQVIGERTARMVAAGPFPGASDGREFAKMGTEKIIAFSDAWLGAAREIVSLQQEMVNVAGRQWWTLLRAWSPLLRGRGMTSLPGAVMSGMMAAGNRAASALPRAAHAAVAPIHAKATSNARRLHNRP